jgi:hypothetical protein
VRQSTSHAEIEEEELGNGGVGSAGAGDKASSVGEARGTAVRAWCEGPGEPRRIGTNGALQEMLGRGVSNSGRKQGTWAAAVSTVGLA